MSVCVRENLFMMIISVICHFSYLFQAMTVADGGWDADLDWTVDDRL